MLIIGITGTLGAGKGTIVKYLVEKKNFTHLSVSDYLKKVISKKNLSVNRQNMVKIANDIRKKHGASYIVDVLLKKANRKRGNVVIESLRTPAEIQSLKKQGEFYLFAVDAKRKARYERIRERQSEKDNVTFKKFVKSEKQEMKSSDPTKQNLAKCIKMADYIFINDGTTGELYEKVKKAIKKIK